MQTAKEIIINRKNLEDHIEMFQPVNPEVILKLYDISANIRKKYETELDKKILELHTSFIKESIENYHNAKLSLIGDYILEQQTEKKLSKNLEINKYFQAWKKTHEILLKNLSEFINENKILSENYHLIEKHGHKPAFIFLLNFDKNNKNHVKHTYGGKWELDETKEITKIIGKSIFDTETERYMELISKDDNATAISNEGIVEGIMTQLVNINPSQIRKDHPEYPENHLMIAGGHSRNNSANGWSYWVKDSPAMVLGESGYIRIFKDGLNTFSSVKSEREAIENFFGIKYKI